ncbi:MAG: glutamate synthase central domain-containing protein [Candidatus Latescibacterota bacterium]
MGYGASAVNPYLALDTLFSLRDQGVIKSSLSNEAVVKKYTKAIGSGFGIRRLHAVASF